MAQGLAFLYMELNRFSKVCFKFLKTFTAVGEFLIKEENSAGQRIVAGVYLNSSVVAFMNYGFLCHTFSSLHILTMP